MGYLNYLNLEEHRPDMLMKLTVNNLKDHYQFIDNAIKYLESDKAVLKLEWKHGIPDYAVTWKENTELSNERTGYCLELLETDECGFPEEALIKILELKPDSNLFYQNSIKEGLERTKDNELIIRSTKPEKNKYGSITNQKKNFYLLKQV